MTAPKNDKKRQNTGTKPKLSEASPMAGGSRVSSRDILQALKDVQSVVEKSVTGYEHVVERLDGQDQSILSIVAAMRDLRSTVDLSAAQQAAGAAIPGPHTVTESPEGKTNTAASAVEQATEQDGVSNGDWEDIRRAFLQEHASGESAEAIAEPAAAAPQDTAEPDASDDEMDDTEVDTILAELPAAIEPVSMDIEELHSGVIDRDRMISVLARRLQKRNRKRQTLSPEQLAEIVDGLPEELAERVTESLELVTQQVRLGELELSLERARVSRQLSKLDDTRNRLESNARLLGLTIAEDGTIEGNTEQLIQQGSKGRRWLGVLGFGN